MTTNKNTKKTEGHAGLKAAGIIGGLAAATAAGIYFLHHNKGAQKKMKNIKGWVIKAKGEILEKVEKLKEVNEDLYNNAVDAVMTRYKKLSTIDGTELAVVTAELKSHWKNIAKELKGGAKAVSSGAKSVKSAVKHVMNGDVVPKAKKAAK
jgi:hypothetical protein